MAQLDGMNIGQCRKGSSQITTLTQQIKRVEQDVNSKIMASRSFWLGEDATAFRSKDRQTVATAFHSLEAQVSRVKKQLDANVTDQSKTSRAR